jgi:hypothetical protein
VAEWINWTLTYDWDRTVAVFGTAREIYNKSSDRYVAGMCQSDLAIQLCWFIEDNARILTPSYLAPTWSWLSTTGRVLYPRSYPSYRTGNEEIWIINPEHKLQSSSNDVFRGHSAGALLLTCSLVLPIESEPRGMIFYKSKNKLECSIYLDVPSQPSHEIRVLPILSHQDGSLIQG